MQRLLLASTLRQGISALSTTAATRGAATASFSLLASSSSSSATATRQRSFGRICFAAATASTCRTNAFRSLTAFAAVPRAAFEHTILSTQQQQQQQKQQQPEANKSDNNGDINSNLSSKKIEMEHRFESAGSGTNNSGGGNSSSGGGDNGGFWKKFWAWATRERPTYPRWSKEWVREMLIVCAIFGVVGSSTMKFVRPLLAHLGLHGTMMEGPWSYRIGSILIMTPLYTAVLITIGTLCGRHPYFAAVALRMWKRMLPQSLLIKCVCPPARAKLLKAGVEGAK